MLPPLSPCSPLPSPLSLPTPSPSLAFSLLLLLLPSPKPVFPLPFQCIPDFPFLSSTSISPHDLPSSLNFHLTSSSLSLTTFSSPIGLLFPYLLIIPLILRTIPHSSLPFLTLTITPLPSPYPQTRPSPFTPSLPLTLVPHALRHRAALPSALTSY